jgi:drug/metabolite transporter (DMT)-like permease
VRATGGDCGGEIVTLLALVLVLVSQVALVTGQILLKHGMNHFGKKPRQLGRVVWGLGGGIAMMTVWFLLWMGLLQKMDLSFLCPFQGITPVLLVLAAGIFLKERADRRTWMGVGLITAGTFLVTFSVSASRG